MTALTQKARFLRLARVLVPFSTLACFCPTPPQPPPADTCATAGVGSVDSVELAASRLNATGYAQDRAADDLPPRPLADDDVLWLLRGGQGAEMVGVRLVLRGAEVPDCIAQDTQARVASALVGENKEQLATYAFGDGARATRSFWLPGAYGTEAVVTTRVLGRTATVRVRTAGSETCDQLGLCPCARALDCRCADGLSDAGASAWSALSRCVTQACDAGLGVQPTACERAALADAGPCRATAQACADDVF